MLILFGLPASDGIASAMGGSAAVSGDPLALEDTCLRFEVDMAIPHCALNWK